MAAAGHFPTREVVSAYGASLARVLAWAGVTALLVRRDPAHLAVLALLRGTLALLNYAGLGLGPAMVTALAAARRAGDGDGAAAALRGAYASALVVAGLFLALGTFLTVAYAFAAPWLHERPAGIGAGTFTLAALLVGTGTVLRLASEASGAALQTRGRIVLDNQLLAGAEAAWLALTAAALAATGDGLLSASAALAAASSALLAARLAAARSVAGMLLPRRRDVDRAAMAELVRRGSIISLSGLADFLYAPVAFILINRLIDPAAVAPYAAAVQVDSALLLIATGVATVALPKAAAAQARGDAVGLRQVYLGGTLGTAWAILVAALLVWLASPLLLPLWLGRDPAVLSQVTAILPLVLVHTVLGGSSAVGRSVLLGMGLARPYATAALTAGALNVALGYAFVRGLGWGLNGIVAATVVAVAARCLLWMPWYVLRATRGEVSTRLPPR